MANIISNDAVGEAMSLRLSNGGMSVVVSMMALAGSVLARTKSEIDMVTWIASRDQGVVGLGTVGFDINELPWDKSETAFAKQKQFLLDCIERVKQKIDLHKLDYDPPFIVEYMDRFEEMICSFLFQHVTTEEADWYLSPNENLEKCKKHDVFLHVCGCVVCNDK